MKFPRLACLLLVSVQAQATPSFYQGFYAGGALGVSWGHADWGGVSEISAANNDGASLTIFESWTPDGQSSVTEFAGTGIFGYQFIHQSLYLSAELGWTVSDEYEFDLNQSQSFNIFYLTPLYTSLVADAQINDQATLSGYQFNMDLKPGWLFWGDRILAYGRVGLAVNELTLESAGMWTNITSFFGVPTTLSTNGFSKEHRKIVGFRLGLGTETLITENLGMTLDYVYTNLGSITTKSQSTADGQSTGNQTHIIGLDAPEVLLSTQSLMLGLLFHW